MNLTKFISRRLLMQFCVSTLGTALVTAPSRAATDWTPETGASALDEALSKINFHAGSAAVIGTAYLDQYSEERSTDVLLVKLMGSLPSECQVDTQAVLERIRVDFACGDVVNLHGWLLSRTEARLCALYAA